jgi:phosphatidylethanolamine/phosphatidyl-N-methylethanolamine N-methyltransferase
MQQESGRQYWERNARNYDRSMRVLGGPLTRAVELSAQAVHGASRVLEVAAGTGLVTVALARSAGHVVATDYAGEMVLQLRQKLASAQLGNVTCEAADVYALRYEPQSFDAVVASNVLHLLPDLPGALAALRRVLKPGGLLIVPTYCHDQTPTAWLLSRLLALTGFPGQRRFTLRGLQAALAAAGVQVSRAELLPGLLPMGYVEGRFSAA